MYALHVVLLRHCVGISVFTRQIPSMCACLWLIVNTTDVEIVYSNVLSIHVTLYSFVV